MFDAMNYSDDAIVFSDGESPIGAASSKTETPGCLSEIHTHLPYVSDEDYRLERSIRPPIYSIAWPEKHFVHSFDQLQNKTSAGRSQDSKNKKID